MSLTVVHLAIKYAYHFFLVNQSIEISDAKGDHEKATKMNKTRVLLAINFFSPLIVLFLFIPQLSKNFIVPETVSESTFEIIRASLILGVILLKCTLFYEELQFNFDENYLYIQKLIQLKDEKLFKYIQLKMKLKFISIWKTCFQYMSVIMLPALML